MILRYFTNLFKCSVLALVWLAPMQLWATDIEQLAVARARQNEVGTRSQ